MPPKNEGCPKCAAYGFKVPIYEGESIWCYYHFARWMCLSTSPLETTYGLECVPSREQMLIMEVIDPWFCKPFAQRFT